MHGSLDGDTHTHNSTMEHTPHLRMRNIALRSRTQTFHTLNMHLQSSSLRTRQEVETHSIRAKSLVVC